jgi:prefoldin subunit 5
MKKDLEARLKSLEKRMDKVEAFNAKIMQDVHDLIKRLVEIFARNARFKP